MNILITGGAGFIGSTLADALLAEGHKVICFDNFDPFYPAVMKFDNISQASANPNYYLVQGDVRVKQELLRCFTEHRVDAVVHLAAKAGVRPSILDPASYYEVNVTGTLNLLELMKENGVNKLIFSSSSSVYGNNAKIPFCETDLVDNPISPYAASKKAGELLCHTYHHLYGFDIFCLRFFTVYGPRQRPDLAINKFVRALLEEKEIPVFGDGNTERDYTYVGDIVGAIIRALQVVKGYEIINLGNSSPVSLSWLIRELESVTGRKAKLVHLPMQPGDVRVTYADVTKAKRILDYEHATPLKSGLRNFIEWLSDPARITRSNTNTPFPIRKSPG
jgi:UDP-glucuronate 4-epimerase